MDTLTVAANGLTFGALAWGDPADPLALLVHGYPDTPYTWRRLAPLLAAQDRYVVAPATRGYGPTDVPDDGCYLARVLGEDLVALHAALGGDDRAVLVGHDWGAVAAYAVAASAPTTFRRLVTLAVPPPVALLQAFTSLRTLPTALRQLGNSWYFAYNQLPVEGTLDRVVAKHWRDWSPGYDAAEDVAHVLAALDTPARRRAALGYYRQNLRPAGAAEGFRATPTAPVLYLHGNDDGCMRADLAASAHLPAGSGFALVPGAGHFLQLEQPEQVHALIEDWIA